MAICSLQQTTNTPSLNVCFHCDVFLRQRGQVPILVRGFGQGTWRHLAPLNHAAIICKRGLTTPAASPTPYSAHTGLLSLLRFLLPPGSWPFKFSFPNPQHHQVSNTWLAQMPLPCALGLPLSYPYPHTCLPHLSVWSPSKKLESLFPLSMLTGPLTCPY